MLFWYFRTAISMEEGKLDSQHRSDISSLESRRRRPPRQRLRSSPDVFINQLKAAQANWQ